MEPISTDIIESSQNGDLQAYSQLVLHFENALHSFVYRMLDRTMLANDSEDMVQEIFIKAYKNISRFDISQGNQFSTWLFTIARNHCLSELRRKSTRHDLRTFEEGELDRIEDSHYPSPREKASQNELALQVRDAINKLPEQMKSTFILSYYEDLPYQEIGEVLGCSVGTVKSRISRAREHLAETLSQHKGNTRS